MLLVQVSGALFAASIVLFADGCAHSGMELYDEDKADFRYGFAGLVSYVGLLVVAMLSPERVLRSEGAPATGVGALQGAHPFNKETLLFCFAWCLELSASIGALILCGMEYLEPSTKASSFPGIAVVLQTCLVALSAAALWAGKLSDDGSSQVIMDPG
jgi:hypothetical protein